MNNFKNYIRADAEFRGSIHCFLGRNGSGKTNLLEAIHYLCLTKGITAASDAENVRQGEGHFLVRGTFLSDHRMREVSCVYAPDRKRKMAEDGKEYARFSDHIGKYPLVMVAPADIELVWDGGEVRRRFFDTLLSQFDREYLEQLILYQANLRHRNGLLKMYADRPDIDKELLATYDDRLVTAGAHLHRKRKEFVATLVPRLMDHYNFLVEGAAERVGIEYSSDLDTLDLGAELRARLSRDLILGRTTVGVHRDEFRFTLQGNDLRTFGSQGQQKSFLIALKMAEFDSLTERNGFKPLLLLDDIFDKLDDRRIVQLMKRVAEGGFGQIFLTDARPTRSREALAEAGINAQVFLVEGGTLAEQV